jgi:hypothetical protein
MRKIAYLPTLICFSLSLLAQNLTPSEQPKSDAPQTDTQKSEPGKSKAPQWMAERPDCKVYRIGDPKGEWCGRTCDTGLEARCIAQAADSPKPLFCGCVKARGMEGVNAFSLCRAVKKDAEGHEWERCAIACDKKTVATCSDAPMYPAPGSVSCACQPKPAQKKP